MKKQITEVVPWDNKCGLIGYKYACPAELLVWTRLYSILFSEILQLYIVEARTPPFHLGPILVFSEQPLDLYTLLYFRVGYYPAGLFTSTIGTLSRISSASSQTPTLIG